MFDALVGGSSNPSGVPEVTLLLRCKISPSNGESCTIHIESSNFVYYPSSATNRFNEICVAMKYHLMDKINC